MEKIIYVQSEMWKGTSSNCRIFRPSDMLQDQKNENIIIMANQPAPHNIPPRK